MDKAETSIETLNQLRELDVALVVDNFGRGYSSLSSVKHFPFEVLRIDRSFVSDIGHPAWEATIQTVASLAQALGLGVIAEGVETRAQAASLEQIGCELAQGYHNARPRPAQKIAQLIGRALPSSAVA